MPPFLNVLRRRAPFVLMFALLMGSSGGAPLVRDAVNWPGFMARHDMVWARLPDSWKQALWFGNGVIGSMIWLEGDRIRLQVFRTDVQDHRSFRVGYSGYSRPRLQIGSFYLRPRGHLLGGEGRTTLYDAEFTGTVRTDRGTLKFRHLVHSSDPVIYTEVTGEKGEADPNWTWEPAEAKPTRPGFAIDQAGLSAMRAAYGTGYFAELYRFNPAPEICDRDGVSVSRQLLLAGAEHSVAWKITPGTATEPQRCAISIATALPGEPQFSDEAAVRSVAAVARYSVSERDAWLGRHRDWWHAFYRKSFLSLSDTRAETVYWTQMYKLGSATRDGSPIVDHGLWQTPSPWTFLTWDLNIQLSYWATTTSNHLELGMGLLDWMWDHRAGLIANVPEAAWRADSARAPLNSGMDLYQPKEADERILDNAEANLTWAMHDCWMIYRRTMDDRLLREKIYPLLKRAVNNQLHHLYESGGQWHMPATESPEYGMVHDANYELASLRWGCETLLTAAARLGLADRQIPQWRDVLKRLAPYPVDANGFMVGADEPFRKAHRHASHLLMIYPYCLVNVDQPENRALIQKSVGHFFAMNQAGYEKAKSWNVFAGYTYTFLALQHAVMGEGDAADKFLNGFIDYPLVTRNGMYAEAGPVIETPLSAAHCIDEMLLQSWGDRLRIFPAVPRSWPDAVFNNLLAEGAFEVSAVRKSGTTQWVRVKSLAGEPCKIRTGIHGPITARGNRSFQVSRVDADTCAVDLKRGEEVLLCPADAPLDATIVPVLADPAKTNWYGLK
jgi:alpha-L-fucosidase 2